MYIYKYMYMYMYIYVCIYHVLSENAFSTYLFCFLVYHLNLLLFRVTLSVHLKITTVVDVIAA